VDIDREIRKISRALGVEVKLSYDGKTPIMVHIDDWEASKFRLTHPLGPPSRWKQSLMEAHSTVYLQRGREKYREQGGVCCFCAHPMSGTANTNIDHIKTRHPRDDTMENIRVCHQEPCHRLRHEGKLDEVS